MSLHEHRPCAQHPNRTFSAACEILTPAGTLTGGDSPMISSPESPGQDGRAGFPVLFPALARQPDLPAIEREMLKRWREEKVSEGSLSGNADGPVWTFYECPPTANGKPGVHHVESRTFE